MELLRRRASWIRLAARSEDRRRSDRGRRRPRRFGAAARSRRNGQVLRERPGQDSLSRIRVRLSVDADRRRRIELDNRWPEEPFRRDRRVQERVPLIAADLRNAYSGQSTGPLEVDRPWDSFTDDHIGLMDHLGIDKFMVMGFCIGGPFIWSLLERAPKRVVAAVLAQPSGSRPEARDLFYETNMKGWGPEFVKRNAGDKDGDGGEVPDQDVSEQS